VSEIAESRISSLTARLKVLARGLANYRMLGMRRTLGDGLIYLLQYHPEHDHSFDRKHGTDTSGRLSPTQIVFPNDEAARSAMVYVASPASVTRWMLDRLDIDPAGYSFVDIGCGKGRVVLIASEYGFREVIGIEVVEELCRVAERNAAGYGARRTPDVSIRCEDAASAELPAGPTVIHLYHPFDESMLARVLRNVEAAHKRSPARRIVAYLLPTGVDHRVLATFDKFPFLRPAAYHPSLGGEFDWAIYHAE